MHCFTCQNWNYHSLPATIKQTHELSHTINPIDFGEPVCTHETRLEHHSERWPFFIFSHIVHNNPAILISRYACTISQLELLQSSCVHGFRGIIQILMLWYHRVPIPRDLNSALPHLLRDRILQGSLDHCTLQGGSRTVLSTLGLSRSSTGGGLSVTGYFLIFFFFYIP